MATYYDKEINIFLDMQDEITSRDCLILSDKRHSENYYLTACVIDELINKEIFSKKWNDTSAKNILPPDFINDNDKIMMEVMRIDDHVVTNKKNVYKQLESKRYDEIKKLLRVPDNVNIQIITNTGLPTDEDHNYYSYKNNFLRVVGKHLNKIQKYKENHPGYKTLFFLFDESSGTYFEIKDIFKPRLHNFYLDKKIVDIILKSDLDYFVWYAPYKIIGNNVETLNLYPKAIIYDLKNIDYDLFIDYDEKFMKSTEL